MATVVTGGAGGIATVPYQQRTGGGGSLQRNRDISPFERRIAQQRLMDERAYWEAQLAETAASRESQTEIERDRLRAESDYKQGMLGIARKDSESLAEKRTAEVTESEAAAKARTSEAALLDAQTKDLTEMLQYKKDEADARTKASMSQQEMFDAQRQSALAEVASRRLADKMAEAQTEQQKAIAIAETLTVMASTGPEGTEQVIDWLTSDWNRFIRLTKDPIASAILGNLPELLPGATERGEQAVFTPPGGTPTAQEQAQIDQAYRQDRMAAVATAFNAAQSLADMEFKNRTDIKKNEVVDFIQGILDSLVDEEGTLQPRIKK